MDVSLVLINANVLTMQRSRPRAEAVALLGERIAAVGSNADISRIISPETEVIDCHGLTLLPGFNDAHCHIPGLARRLQDLDCSPPRASSMPALLGLVRQRAESSPAGSWVRGYGYDDLRMAERRHPNRWELDAAAPSHPVWLEHRSGHASALNSRALELAGIHRETPDPPGGIIERDTATGEPTGTLFEMQSFLRLRLGNLRSSQEFEDGMREAGQLLSAYGITSVQDAGADNGLDRWRTFQRLQAGGMLSCRMTMFAGVEKLEEFAGAVLRFGAGDNHLRLGHAKIMLTMTSGGLHPSLSELARLVDEAHRRGFPVAVHCIEEEAIELAANVLASHPHPNPPPEGEGMMGADRIEHCAEGTPTLVDAIRQSGVAVVTNPGFLYHNGGSYRENVDTRLLPHLYPSGALHRSGVAVAFGSDTPVVDPNPWPAIYSAVTRCDSNGIPLSVEDTGCQTVSVEEALRMYTSGSAEAEGTSGVKGSIAPGNLADMALVDADPLSVKTEDLPFVTAVMTIVGGAFVWGKI